MAIVYRLGFFSDALLSRPGAKKALVETLRSTRPHSVGRPEGALSADYYSRHKAGDDFTPIPVVPGTPQDLSVFLRTANLGTPSDLTASITLIIKLKSLYAYINGMSAATVDMGGYLRSWHSVYSDMYSYIIGSTSSHTEAHTYDYTILSTPGGVSILRRFLTTKPDLYATIAGWDYRDLAASLNVVQIHYNDLYAFIATVAQVYYDLQAYLGPTHLEDITSTLTPVPPSGLPALLTAVEASDLITSLVTIPGVDLRAFGGGHYPADITANLISSPPKDLAAMLRPGLSGIYDLTASLTSIGYYNNIPGYIRGLTKSSSKLKASIIVKIPKSLYAYIHGRATSDITAYIKGVNELNMLCRIVGWSRENESDMPGFLRPGWANTSSMSVFLHGVISTHTSNKAVNFHKLSRPFNSFLVGTRGGLSFVTIEPIWGNFPDLLASIVGNPLTTYDMRAFLRIATRASYDLGASISAVTKIININKVIINFVNVSSLSAYITAYSGYNPMKARVFGWKSASTNTPSGSGWVYVSSTLKFYIGTSKGLFIPERIVRAVRPDRFVNYSNFPDLWGYMHGWDVLDLSASIAVQQYNAIYASLTAQDLSHTLSLLAYLTPLHTTNLTAQISAIGSYTDMLASLIVGGEVKDLTASIRPYLKVLGYRIIPVETKPLFDLRAVLNPIASCNYNTTYATISAFIRGNTKPQTGVDLLAYLNVLSNIGDLSASIVGKKITRLKLANLMFRAQTRSSYALSAVVIGEAWSTNDMVAYIVPLHHTSDMSASITPYYPKTTYTPHELLTTIDVYKMVNQNAQLYKQISMLFDTKVESYIYDSIQKALYSIGDDRWVLNFSELSETGEFFDKSTEDKTYLLDNIVEYDSVDEAIRAAIQWLTEPQTNDLSASITAVGGYSDMRAIIDGLYIDRVSDLPTSLYIVNNDPSLSAYISAFSGYGAMKASVVGYGSSSPSLPASVRGVIYTGLSATINGIT